MAATDSFFTKSYIQQHNLDLDHITIRKSRPYILSCTKNDNSHQRTLARRAEDEKLLRKIIAI